jgi:NitT/TauT family transport system substrate-binding protein
VQVVNADALRDRKDVMLRFMRAYRETLDWMYASPEAVKLYAEKMKMPEELVVLQRDQFNPKDAMLPDRLSDLDLVMEDAVALKFLDKPMTKDELNALFQIPPPGS